MAGPELLDLPQEIIFRIVSLLWPSRHLYNFLRTNHALHNLLIVELYKRVINLTGGLVFQDYVRREYEPGVRNMLAAGVNVDVNQFYHFSGTTPTALLRAVYAHKLDTAKFLLERGANPNYRDSWLCSALGSAIHGRSSGEDTSMLELLLDYNADVNLVVMDSGLSRFREARLTPLSMAIRVGQVAKVKLLLARGANIHARELPIGQTPLHIASEKGRSLEVLQVILDAGAKVDCIDNEALSPLHTAAFDLATGAIQLLLKYGADINLHSPTGPNAGQTALHYVAATPYEPASETMTFLIEHGADVNVEDARGRTPLHLVRQENNAMNMYTRARILLQNGANTHARDHAGWSVLHYQADSVSVELFMWLCDRGCDVKWENDNGETPIILAKRSRNHARRKPVITQAVLSLGASNELTNQ